MYDAVISLKAEAVDVAAVTSPLVALWILSSCADTCIEPISSAAADIRASADRPAGVIEECGFGDCGSELRSSGQQSETECLGESRRCDPDCQVDR